MKPRNKTNIKNVDSRHGIKSGDKLTLGCDCTFFLLLIHSADGISNILRGEIVVFSNGKNRNSIETLSKLGGDYDPASLYTPLALLQMAVSFQKLSLAVVIKASNLLLRPVCIRRSTTRRTLYKGQSGLHHYQYC